MDALFDGLLDRIDRVDPFAGITMTPARRAAADWMDTADEGLTPRAYRCLLRVGDGLPLTDADAAWLTDGVEADPIAQVGDAGAVVLTPHGAALFAAANAGDCQTIFDLTQ